MDLTLTYDEAIDFIINLDETNLSHDNHKAYIYEARKILIDLLKSRSFVADETGFYSYTENTDGSVSIGDFRRYEDMKYSSDLIRAFMENKSLMERLTPAGTSDKKQPDEITENNPKALKAENERLKAELEQKGKLPAVAKLARQFVLNQIKDGYPEGEFKGWKHEAIAEEVIERAKCAGYKENDIPLVSTIIRHYFKK